MTRAAVVLLCTLLAAVLLPVAANAQPAFYETILVHDEPDDFPQGALDLRGLYVKEVAPYDSLEGTSSDLVVIRVEPRNLADASQCHVWAATASQQACSIQYDVRFDANGSAHHLFVRFGPQGAASRCCPIEDANVPVFFNDTSASFLIDRAEYGLDPGVEITRLFATSALVRGPAVQKADRIPGDNGQLPYDQRPEIDGLFADPYRVRGTYPFFRVAVIDGLVRNSVGGQDVKFSFLLEPTPHVVDDTIRVRFDAPQGWAVTPSRGSTGANPTGLVTGISHGTSIRFDFSASATDITDEGDLAPIGVHFFSASGGHVFLVATVRVTGAFVELPGYLFVLDDAGPFRAGEPTVVKFRLLDENGAPRVGVPIEARFQSEGRSGATVAAESVGDGYRAAFTFPTAGTWTLRLSVEGLRPAPSAAFTMHVDDAAAAPGPGLVALLLGLAALPLVRRATRGGREK